MQFIDLKIQSQRIEERLIASFKKVLNHGSYVMGPEVFELEDKLKKFIGVDYAITTSSGTDALLMALMALGIGQGDEVITTAFSFFSTVEVIVLLGATPVFVDIDKDTYNIDANLIEAHINKNTKAILPVSLYGQCADFDVINQIAAKYQIPVIEDGAQSFGATYKDRKSLGLTTIGCTSFFPSKPLGCYGDGGAIFTNNPQLAKKLAEIRIHGQSKRYTHTSIGITGRLDTMQAAFLSEKLEIFSEEMDLRQKVASDYNNLLGKDIKKQKIMPDNKSVYAQYTIEVENRSVVQHYLQHRSIPTAIHYPVGLHEQPVIRNLFPDIGPLPKTELAAKKVLSLPMHPYLTLNEQKLICSELHNALEESSVEAELV